MALGLTSSVMADDLRSWCLFAYPIPRLLALLADGDPWLLPWREKRRSNPWTAPDLFPWFFMACLWTWELFTSCSTEIVRWLGGNEQWVSLMLNVIQVWNNVWNLAHRVYTIRVDNSKVDDVSHWIHTCATESLRVLSKGLIKEQSYWNLGAGRERDITKLL